MTSTDTIKRPAFRLYIDEVGHASIKSAPDENERYLSLIGVACHLDYVMHTLINELEYLKRFFLRPQAVEQKWLDPDEPISVRKPIIFHRKELAERKYPFDALQDEAIRQAFDKELLDCLERWEYTVFCVIIDKEELRNRYSNPAHPYHYGMEILLERYVKWLEQNSALGDVMAEARGGKEDRELKEHYKALYQSGTGYVASSQFANYLSSRELKIKAKQENVAGLQLAEFLVRPCFYAALARKNNQPIPTNFGGKIEAIVQKNKYYRSGTLIEGYGRKWLP